jgi:hypothetical protein
MPQTRLVSDIADSKVFVLLVARNLFPYFYFTRCAFSKVPHSDGLGMEDATFPSVSLQTTSISRTSRKDTQMRAKHGSPNEDLDRWENEGGSPPARPATTSGNGDPNAKRRHIHQPASPSHRPQGIWGMCFWLISGIGRMFGFRKEKSQS